MEIRGGQSTSGGRDNTKDRDAKILYAKISAWLAKLSTPFCTPGVSVLKQHSRQRNLMLALPGGKKILKHC